jgi:hypothetical protein
LLRNLHRRKKNFFFIYEVFVKQNKKRKRSADHYSLLAQCNPSGSGCAETSVLNGMCFHGNIVFCVTQSTVPQCTASVTALASPTGTYTT